MYVVHQQPNRSTVSRVALLAGLAPLLHELKVELDEEQRLVLHGREQVVLADEVEDVRAPEAQEVGQRLARLSVQ